MKIRTPRTTAAATELLERHAAREAELALVEGNRGQALAETNAAADALAMPLIEELAAIRAALEPWWKVAAGALCQGKRKSIELGGCAIGTVSGRATLSIAGDEKALLAEMRTLRWAVPYVRVTPSIDRVAALKGIDGRHAAGLRALGFSRKDGDKTFFVRAIAAGAGETVAR